MVDFQKLIKAWLFDYRKNRAIKKAQKLATLNRRKYLVLVSAGKSVVVSMQGVRKLIKQHRFTKGFTAEKAREIAIFEALPKPTA